MKITKKVCIYILVSLITITGTFSSFYKGAYAFEYVGGALAFEEAIKWLLASVGIISAGGMTADYWEQHGQEFEDYCTQQNITDTEVVNWQFKLCEGILDKSSACWSAFKSWASSLLSSSSDDIVFTSGTCQDVFNNILLWYNSNNSSYSLSPLTLSSTIADTTIYGFYLNNVDFTYHGQSNYYAIQNIFFFTEPNTFVIGSGSNARSVSPPNKIYLNFIKNNYVGSFGSDSRYSSLNNQATSYITDNITDSSNVLNLVNRISWGGGAVSNSDFIGLDGVDVTDLDVISSVLPDENASEVSIPMPGVADSDNTASADAYDDIVDLINDGTITIDDGLERIQALLKIITYDTVTDDVIPIQPDPDTGENKKKDDVVNENKDNMGFTLSGLETVFPFCIPWDLYAFMSLLRADPVPPKVELPFPNPLDPENPWTVEVDFSDWDDGMRIVRLAEDFLFIIGLAVLTRSLIGAGGGDG